MLQKRVTNGRAFAIQLDFCLNGRNSQKKFIRVLGDPDLSNELPLLTTAYSGHRVFSDLYDHDTKSCCKNQPDCYM
jgi:hypothetical protein